MPSSTNLIWEHCKQEFEFEGTWRDIYVLDTSDRDWNIFLHSLWESNYKTDVWIDNESAEPIRTIQVALDIRDRANPYMLINASSVQIACHFFTDEQIEFDLDPRQVNNQEDLDAVFDFMIFLGNLLQKPVILTAENYQDIVVFEFKPSKQEITHYDVEYLDLDNYQ